jgi:predicted Zn-dependent protease with MMP-like domain
MGRSPFQPLMGREEFEGLVAEAMASIPARFRKLI